MLKINSVLFQRLYCLSLLFYVSTQASFSFCKQETDNISFDIVQMSSRPSIEHSENRPKRGLVDVDAHCTCSCLTFGLFRNFIYSVELKSRTSNEHGNLPASVLLCSHNHNSAAKLCTSSSPSIELCLPRGYSFSEYACVWMLSIEPCKMYDAK